MLQCSTYPGADLAQPVTVHSLSPRHVGHREVEVTAGAVKHLVAERGLAGNLNK